MKLNLVLSSAIIAVICLTTACSDAPSGPPTFPSDARVDSIFAHYTVEGSPGAAVIVILDGEILHVAGYGLADLESGALLTPETPIRLGSVSKQFFAMGIMILAERDSLAYDDLVINWVPELNRFPGITIRHLLNHTSGLPDYYDEVERLNPQIDNDPLISNSEAASVYESWGDFNFKPGEKYRYSNPGYEMLALVIERISGQSSRQFLHANVFSPLDMITADVRDRRDFKIPNSAVGYSMNEDSTAWVENDDNEFNGLVGAGGVYASLLDMYRWDQSLYEGGAVSKESLEEAFRPATLNDGTMNNYGFGWQLGDRDGHKRIFHGGSWVGFRTHINRFVDDKLTVIILTNSTGQTGRYQNQIASLYLE